MNHSSAVRADLLGRAQRTYTALYELIFGTVQQALATSRRLHVMHARVRGVAEAETTAPAAGRPYRANDPLLMRWVWATLVEVPLRFFERIHRPLSAQEHLRNYQEACMTAVLLGIPPEVLPPTRADFRVYFQGMLDGPELAVGSVARELSSRLFQALLTRWTTLDEVLSAGLLPASLRDAYGLPWDRAAQRRFNRLIKGLRLTVRTVPAPLRQVPAYHQACLRIERALGRPGPPYARALDRLAQVVPLPLRLPPER